MNAMFRTWKWESTDCILLLDTAYGMVKNAVRFLADKYALTLPPTTQQF